MTSDVGRRVKTLAPVRGFTLLELMIVVVIISILAAIAIPTYRRYAIRAHRVDGQELLLRVANAQERYYSTTNQYGTLADVGYTDTNSEKGYYSVSVAQASSQAFTATATPLDGQTADDCQNLTINNVGVKDSSGTTTNGSCW